MGARHHGRRATPPSCAAPTRSVRRARDGDRSARQRLARPRRARGAGRRPRCRASTTSTAATSASRRSSAALGADIARVEREGVSEPSIVARRRRRPRGAGSAHARAARRRRPARGIERAVRGIIAGRAARRRSRARRVHAPLRRCRRCRRRRCACPPATSPRRSGDQPASVRRDLRLAARRIRAFHAASASARGRSATPAGARLGQLIQPLERVGVYVPGGRAAYPSTVLMNVVPARVAGVARGDRGVAGRRRTGHPPVILAACHVAGVDALYRVGGAQAVAALAYGTRHDPARRQDRRSGERLRRDREAAGVRAGRHRLDRRPERGADRRRRLGARRDGRGRPAGAGRARPAGRRGLRHARPAARRARWRRRSTSSSPTLPRRAHRARARWRASARSSSTASLAEASRSRTGSRPSTSSCWSRDAATLGCRASATPARSSSAPHAPEAFGDYLAGPNHVLPTGGDGALRVAARRLRLREAHQPDRGAGRARSRGSGPAVGAPRAAGRARRARALGRRRAGGVASRAGGGTLAETRRAVGGSR